MIPAEFDYVRASSVAHAIQLLGEHGEDAKLLAGGHSLLPLMKLRLARPSVLIDVRTLPELQGVRRDGEVLSIGAGTCHRVLERDPLVARSAALLSTAAQTIGDPQVRSRGTIGGSLVHADPAADLPAVLLALEAAVLVRGPGGDREIAISEFFLDLWQTAIAADEVLLEIRIPVTDGQPTSFHKFRQRSQDWGIVGVAAVGGERPRLALANMALTPLRAGAVEAALAGGADITEAAALADVGTSPSSDLRATSSYRRQLARVLMRRALVELAA